MDVLTHVNVGLFPAVLVAVIFGDSLFTGARDLESRLFRALALVLLGTLAAEAASWVVGAAFAPDEGPLRAAMAVYLLFSCAVSLLWLLYVLAKMRGASRPSQLRRPAVLCGAAFALCVAAVAAGVLTDTLFDIDGQEYVRGPHVAVLYAVMAAALLCAVAMPLLRCASTASLARRRQYASLALIGAIPVAGLLLQSLWSVWWAVWPLDAIALLLAYVGIQNVRISVDALTGLLNRAGFDERLAARWARMDGPWCVIMVDLDEFKAVNDRYGHAFGDEALCRTADALRDAFGEGDACVARFGGDEFAVMTSCEGEEGMRRAIGRLHEAMARATAGLRVGALTCSAGGALCDRAAQTDAEDLLAAADRAMYKEKDRRRADAKGGDAR
ncbi:GGDEF domain-containing protein [Arabiibacter massiliensis]|uniref:GGDEF domain-containing protein n=1 Tax=Arabiibacter massiliensis TaxID=1870985 RepID=UPI001179BF6A|nr:GGDEF domain-containing protein [Arabiibacter massiliensis]